MMSKGYLALLTCLAFALLLVSRACPDEATTELRLKAPVTTGGLVLTSVHTPAQAPGFAIEFPKVLLCPNLSLSARQLQTGEGEWAFAGSYGNLRLQGQKKSETGVSLAGALETPLAAISTYVESDVWTAEAKGSNAVFGAADFGEGMGLSGAVAFGGAGGLRFAGSYAAYDLKKKQTFAAPDVNLALDYGSFRCAYLDGATRPAPEKKATLALGRLLLSASENAVGPDSKTFREGTQYGLSFAADKFNFNYRFGLADSLKLQYADGGLRASYLSGDFLWRKKGTPPLTKIDFSYITHWQAGDVEFGLTRIDRETKASLIGEAEF